MGRGKKEARNLGPPTRDEASLTGIQGPELIIGLVGPVGTDLSLVSKVLCEELETVNYESTVVRLSDLLRGVRKYKNLPTRPADTRWESHMTAGTNFRITLGRGDALALLAVTKLTELRKSKTNGIPGPIKNHAFILHSLKHPAEIETLRKIYGKAFLVISAYSPRPRRIDSISLKIARSRSDSDVKAHRSKAEELVQRDEEELETKFGQDVKDAFPLADLFIRADIRAQIKEGLGRFIEALFGYPYHTPSKHEFGMFCAKAASLRSSDLGRQVGAAIASREGDIISMACNEVPKGGGGLYWAGDKDYRDFQIGHDTNIRIKKDLISEILDKLNEEGFLKQKTGSKNVDIRALVDEVLTGGQKPLLRGARIMNLLEFGRTVHAEMAALADAARRGVSVRGATLYSTTFPCHLCARHIVASGIRKVIYVEPYPKSMATDLYPDSIVVDSESREDELVNFEPFVGIAPRRYLDFFEMKVRKDPEGDIVLWSRAEAKPIIERVITSYLMMEIMAVRTLSEQMNEKGLL